MHVPGLGISAGIVYGDIDHHLAKLRPGKPLDDVSLRGSRMSIGIQPNLIVHAHGVHHQRVAIPAAYRIAPPGIHHILVMRAAVEKNLAIAVDVAFVKNDEQLVGLHNFPRVGIDARRSHRKAETLGIILTFVFEALLEKLSGPRQHRDVAGIHVARDVVRVAFTGLAARIAGAVSGSVIDTGEIGLAVRSARRRLPLRRTGHPLARAKILSEERESGGGRQKNQAREVHCKTLYQLCKMDHAIYPTALAVPMRWYRGISRYRRGTAARARGSAVPRP